MRMGNAREQSVTMWMELELAIYWEQYEIYPPNTLWVDMVGTSQFYNLKAAYQNQQYR